MYGYGNEQGGETGLRDESVRRFEKGVGINSGNYQGFANRWKKE